MKKSNHGSQPRWSWTIDVIFFTNTNLRPKILVGLLSCVCVPVHVHIKYGSKIVYESEYESHGLVVRVPLGGCNKCALCHLLRLSVHLLNIGL